MGLFLRPLQGRTRLFWSTQAKAWARFSWPFGPQLGLVGKLLALAQASVWVRFLATTRRPALKLKGQHKMLELRMTFDIEDRPFVANRVAAGWRQLLLEGSDSYNSRFLGML